MLVLRQKCMIALLCLTVLAPGWARESPDRQRLAEQLPGWLAETGTPSTAVALIEDGQLRWTLVSGEQAPGVPATPQTLYNIASLAKPITAELVLRLASSGQLKLDEPISAHWVDPDIADDPRHQQLTPALCLSHQCGFPNWRHETDDKLSFVFEPGERAGYSGEGYQYLGNYLQARMDAPFEQLMQRHLFSPLGMTNTAYTHKPWFEGRIATPMGPEGSWGEPVLREQWVAADDVHTTVADYATLVTHAMAGRDLTAGLAERRWKLEQDIAAMLCESGRLDAEDCPQRLGFTLGWGLHQSQGRSVFFHGGGDWGERSLAFFVPASGFGVVVLTNGASGMTVIRNIAAVLYDNPAFIAFLTMQAESGQ